MNQWLVMYGYCQCPLRGLSSNTIRAGHQRVTALPPQLRPRQRNTSLNSGHACTHAHTDAHTHATRDIKRDLKASLSGCESALCIFSCCHYNMTGKCIVIRNVCILQHLQPLYFFFLLKTKATFAAYRCSNNAFLILFLFFFFLEIL